MSPASKREIRRMIRARQGLREPAWGLRLSIGEESYLTEKGDRHGNHQAWMESGTQVRPSFTTHS